jgi:NAD-dependent dihydropyrimidine dehydrogenase PreA subunit
VGGESFPGCPVRLDLVRDAAAAARLPEVLAERCVHSLIEHATCRRCVDACPTRAWVIDDERLGIDPACCDGCGLCAPACPQAAILGAAEPLRADAAALIACERTWDGAGGPGVTPCVHALGLRDLARLAAAGCGTLVAATGDCERCPRGVAVRLGTRLADLARLLDSRGLPVLRLERLPGDRWQRARAAAAPDPGPAMGRRSFLRRGVGLAIEQARTAFGLAAAERARVETAAGLLPPTAAPRAVVPVAPRIDPAACTGCDACARLCPGGAIRLDVGEGGVAYGVLPDRCTGCGICVDVCADRAVRLDDWLPAGPTSLPLAEATCARCRAPFHRPVIDSAGGRPRCPICERKGEAGRLFRVQE